MLETSLGNKATALETNLKWSKLVMTGRQRISSKRPLFREPLPPMKDCILTDGNNAAALGSLFGGVEFCAWYPITPASSLVESMIEHNPKLRKDP